MVGMVLSSALLTCQRAGEAAPLPGGGPGPSLSPERLSRRKSRAIGPAPRMVTHVLGAGVPRVTPWKRAESGSPAEPDANNQVTGHELGVSMNGAGRLFRSPGPSPSAYLVGRCRQGPGACIRRGGPQAA